MIQRNVGNLISVSSLAQLITRRIYIRFQCVPGNHVMYHTWDVWVGKEGWIASVKAALPSTNTSMGTCTLEPHTVHKHSLPPLSFLDKNTIKGTPSHCGNCISLCGLHVPRTELGQQCGSVCVNMDHKGQDPVLMHPLEQVGAFVSQLKGLPPCLHPTCLPPSVHPSTSGGFLGSPS